MTFQPITNNGLQGGVGNPTSTEGQVSDVGRNESSAGSENLSVDELRQLYEQTRNQYEQDKRKWELDMNNMKSSLQRNTSQVKSEYEQQIEEFKRRVDEATTRNMTDEQRKDYELARAKEENETLRKQYDSVRQSAQEQAQIQQVRDAFVNRYGQYGLSAADIDMTNYETAVASGWEAIGKLIAGKNATTTNPSETQQGKRVVGEETRTKVITNTGQVHAETADPMMVLRREVAKIQGRKMEDIPDELVYSLINSGSLDVNEIFSREFQTS